MQTLPLKHATPLVGHYPMLSRSSVCHFASAADSLGKILFACHHNSLIKKCSNSSLWGC